MPEKAGPELYVLIRVFIQSQRAQLSSVPPTARSILLIYLQFLSFMKSEAIAKNGELTRFGPEDPIVHQIS